MLDIFKRCYRLPEADLRKSRAGDLGGFNRWVLFNSPRVYPESNTEEEAGGAKTRRNPLQYNGLRTR
jgi:hypothetical protein